MVRRLALLIAAGAALPAAASAPVPAAREPVDLELKRTRAEARAAEAELSRLEQAAEQAGNETARLAAQRRAAAAAIAAAEARLSAADAEARLARAQAMLQARELARQQAPVAALLAGIVTMGRHPPLLSSADSGTLDEFVRVRALLDSTLPVIRRRSADLSRELAASERLEASAARARDRLAEARRELVRRRDSFAALEAKAGQRLAGIGAELVSASDTMIASSEGAARAAGAAERRRLELRLAADLGALPAAPPRPAGKAPASPPLAYRLPAKAVVADGFGAISESGIRSRGLTLETYAGQPLLVPAGGTIAFAGPFRRHDGVVIIDHGRGWLTLMTGVRAETKKGQRVQAGQRLGRALGPVTVELSTNGRHVSAALIAGSSGSLFINGKSG